MILKSFQKIAKCNFSSTSKGFVRSGIGISSDSLDKYVDKSIASQEMIGLMKNLTEQYLQAISSKDRPLLQQLAKPKLYQKTIAWIEEADKKGEIIQLLQINSQNVTSLECFTTFNYLYGVNEVQSEQIEAKSDETLPQSKKKLLKGYDLHQGFLVKRIVYLEGFKFWKLFKKQSLVAEAIIYSNLRLQIKDKKISNTAYASSSGSYFGYKICFTCDKQFENKPPQPSAVKLTENKDSNADEINLEIQHGWKIADINDWVFSDQSAQNFTKWALEVALNEAPDLK